jgi:hypothetical protein
MSTSPARRSWLRFSVRTLLVAITLLAIFLAAFVHWRDAKRREDLAAQATLNRGLSVAWVDGRPLAERPRSVQLLALVLPEYCLRTVYWVDFPRDPPDHELALLDDLPNLTSLDLNECPRITPQGLKHLRSLYHLERLSLKQTPVGDAGLAHLDHAHGLKQLWLGKVGLTQASIPWIASNRGLTHLSLDGAAIGDESMPLLATLDQLEVLVLRDTQLTSRGAAHLSQLPQLKHLYLFGTRIDDAGLAHLASMSTLQTLDVRQTAITPTGLSQFKQSQPQCRIEE